MRMKLKPQMRIPRVLTLLLLLCLLCACGASEPRNWVPVGGGSQAHTDPSHSIQTEKTAEVSTEAVPQTAAPTAPHSTKPETDSSGDAESSAETLVPDFVAVLSTEASAETLDTETPPDKGQPASPESTEEPLPITYVVNTNTKKFHEPSCSSVSDMKESNKWYFNGTREELIQQGYEPCKRCKP